MTKLTIKLLVDGRAESNGWISLDTKSRQLQALTWDAPDSQSQFSLVALDSNDDATEEEIEVKVKENSDTETNLYTMTIDAQYSIFANTHMKQVDLYKKINNAFQSAVVRIKSVKEGSLVLQFGLREKSVVGAPPDHCPKDIIDSYNNVMFDGTEIKNSFLRKMGSYQVRSLDFLPLGPCEDKLVPMAAQPSSSVVKVTPAPKEGSLSVIIIVVVVAVIMVIFIVVLIICIRRRKANQSNSQQNGKDIEKRVPVVLDEEMKSINNKSSENEPLMTSAEVSYKPTPPAYPGDEHAEDYHPDTPPISEPDDERRIIGRSP